MNIDLIQIASSIVAALAPFMPFLTELGKEGAKKLTEVVVEKGSETAFKRAQEAWRELKKIDAKDNDFRNAATSLARKPESNSRQAVLAELLVEHFKSDPVFLQKILTIFQESDTIQKIIANNGSIIEGVTQEMADKGVQIVDADNKSEIKNVKQTSSRETTSKQVINVTNGQASYINQIVNNFKFSHPESNLEIAIQEDKVRLLKFISDFENMLDHIGDMPQWIKFIPQQMWQVIDPLSAYYSNAFVEKHGFQKYDKVSEFPKNMAGHQLKEALCFMLKLYWERGYLMYKFYKYDSIPVPRSSIETDLLWDRILENEIPDLSIHIEVFMQKVASFCTEEEPIMQNLSTLSEYICKILEPAIQDWCETSRSVMGYGMLFSKFEELQYPKSGK
jgi:hypothetical protein